MPLNLPDVSRHRHAHPTHTHKGGIMMRSFLTALASLALALLLGAAARAETKVEIKGVHLCCPGCGKTVGEILKKVDGVTDAACDAKAKTVTFTAPDNATAQKALDALAAGGFQGDTGNKDLTFKDDSDTPKGKVKSLTLTGAHNCCGQCCKALKATVKKVEGVENDTIKPKGETFEVTGDFDAAELVKALNAAGFHVKVKK
jgi:copper chaperone CopZ